MKTRVDRNVVAWVCATLCILAVGCNRDLPYWWPGEEESDTAGGSTDGTSGGGTSDDADVGDDGVGVGDDGADVQPTGQLQVLIMDKPYPFEFIAEALVTITRVEVHRVGDDDADTNGVEDDDGDDVDTNGLDDIDTNGVDDDDFDTNGGYQDGPWITISGETKDFDLLQLRNGRTDLLADADIPAGTYNQMRLIVTEGQITLIEEDDVDTNGIDDVGTNGIDDVGTNGRVFSLRVPSGEQSGIKLHFTFEIVADQVTTLLLDVDLSRAFKPIPGGHIDEPGDIRDFTFSPSLGMRLIELLDAGSISGTVTEVGTNGLPSPLPDVAVTAYDNGTEVTTTASNEEGAYTLSGLATGEYRVEFSADGYDDAEVTGIAVTTGQTTEGVDVTLTASAEP